MSAAVEPRPAASPLTDQQEAALRVVGASVALSAGAGCGKTRVLTERFLRYLDPPERRPLRSIVALTFTEKAARELRERVRRSCRDRLERGEEPAYWRSILRGLEAAPIGTFHAFCGNLLRRFPIEAGVEPGFRVLEESIAPTVRDDALARVFRRWLATRDDDLTALAVEHGLSAVRQALTDLVTDRGGHDYRAWADRDVSTILDAWEQYWESTAKRLVLGRLEPLARSILTMLARFDCTHKTMRERLALLREHLPTLGASARPEHLIGEIRDCATVAGGIKPEHWTTPDAHESMKDAFTKLRKEIDKCLEVLNQDQAASELAAEQGLRFARLAAEAVEEFERAKREEGLLDFDDLVVKARDLLRDGPERVRRMLRDEYQVILVDEFQDTDALQSEILCLILGEEIDLGRIFLVGDTKQSIYGFRGARPELFQDYRARFVEGRRELTENFRSAPGVIDFINALFREEFVGEEHQLRARSDGYARTERPAVTFLWACEPERHDDRGKLNVGERRKVEARWLARHIRARLDAGWPIWDERTREVRAANAGDVVFLLRALSDSASYENALVHVGLDYYLVGGSAFFTQQEVLDLINVLTAIEDPTDELALAGALRSPFFGVSDEGLYWLVQAGAGDLPTGLGRCERAHDLSEDDRVRSARAGRLLEGWRAIKDRVPIAALLDRALGDSGYEAALLGEHLGERKRANCRKLVRMARAFDAEGRYTLADFVARLRGDLRKPPREEQAATTDEAGEAVRIMSIHQAKGLEFPIVVMPDLNRDTPPSRDRVAFHDGLGMVVKPPEDREDSSEGHGLGWACFREVRRHEEEAEAIRLLYVAATRARESLILSAGLAADEPPRSPGLRLLAERFDRASGACLAPLTDDLPTPRVEVVVGPPALVAAGRRRRPRLRAAAEAIERARVESVESRPAEPRRPTRIDLDPAIGLSPSMARVDRLVRAILADTEGLDPRALDEVAARAGRAVGLLANDPRLDAAKVMLGGWLGGEMARALAASGEVRRGLPWVISWPVGGPSATVVSGRLDLAAPDGSGGWMIVGLSLAGSDEARERLRLILSARAAGLKPEVRGRLVRLDADGSAEVRFVDAFDDEAVERAVGEVVRS